MDFMSRCARESLKNCQHLSTANWRHCHKWERYEFDNFELSIKMILFQFYIDGLFATTLLLAVLSLRCQSYWLATVCALIYTWTGIAGHNFLHQRDNYRMYYFNLLFINYREWRITHALSHHLFPNSYLDFELLQFEPILDWTPTSKTWSQRYISWLISPFIYVGLLHIECVKK